MASDAQSSYGPKKLSTGYKHAVEKDFKDRIEKTGGTYIGINWKKRKVHFLTPSGQREAKSIVFQQ